MNSLWILTIKLCIPWKIVGIEWISEQINSVGLLLSSPPSLTQFKTYIWNNFSMSHLELVAETSPPDSLLSFQFLPLIMSSRLSLTLNLLRPWTNKWLALFILEDVSLLDRSLNQHMFSVHLLAGFVSWRHSHSHTPPSLHSLSCYHSPCELVKKLLPSSPGDWTPASTCVPSLLKGPQALPALWPRLEEDCEYTDRGKGGSKLSCRKYIPQPRT